MVDCEMCGKKGAGEKKVKIEGTLMAVCTLCAAYGEEVSLPKKVSAKIIRNYAPKKFVDPDEQKRIIPHAGTLIKQAREKKGLKQEQLAKKLNEKESLIHNIEAGKFKPSLKTINKLEKFFELSLTENNQLSNNHEEFSTRENSDEGLTMGDILKNALKK